MRMRWWWGWPAAAALVWVAVGLTLAVHGFFHPRLHTLLDIYAQASHDWWAGRDLYRPTPREYYRYCPLFAVGVTPYALLPEAWGNALWKASLIALYAAGLGAFARRVMPVRGGSSVTAAFFLLALPCSLHSMYNGQANLLVVAACLFGLAAAAGDRWNQAALWLALAALVKVYPLALGLLLAAFRPRRFAPRFAAALGLGVLLPLAAQDPGVAWAQTARWIYHLAHSNGLFRERVRTVDHLLGLYYRPLAPNTFTALGVVAGAAVLALCVVHARRAGWPRELLCYVYMAFACWVALFGPATESCTYVVMAPAAAWGLIDAFTRPASWLVRLMLIASLLLMSLLVTDLFGPAVRTFASAHGSQPVGAILFLAYLLMRTGRTEAPAAPRRAGEPVRLEAAA